MQFFKFSLILFENTSWHSHDTNSNDLLILFHLTLFITFASAGFEITFQYRESVPARTHSISSKTKHKLMGSQSCHREFDVELIKNFN